MSTLIIQDAFAPYYAGRSGFAAPDLTRRRKLAEQAKAEAKAKAKRDDPLLSEDAASPAKEH